LDSGRVEPLKGGADEESQTPGHSGPSSPNEHEAGWDVFADFNNTGPRYSTAFGTQEPTYHSLSVADRKGSEIDKTSSLGPVEMVTVPAMGPEWSKNEMREMTKAGRRERKNAQRGNPIQSFRRDKTGLCGIKWLNRKFLTFFIFALIVVIGIILAFTIPRVPGLQFNNFTPLINATNTAFGRSVPVEFSRAPANFSFPAFAPVQFNTNSNFLTLHITEISGQVLDAETGRQVGNLTLGDTYIPAKTFQVVNLPITFSYIASNDTETTWVNWYDACINPQNAPNGTRPGLNFQLVVQMTIAGLPGTSSASTQVNGANCPVTLPANAP
jgi:hypothetical protein